MSRSVSPTTVVTASSRQETRDGVGQICVDELRASGFNEFDEEETRVTVLEAFSTQNRSLQTLTL